MCNRNAQKQRAPAAFHLKHPKFVLPWARAYGVRIRTRSYPRASADTRAYMETPKRR